MDALMHFMFRAVPLIAAACVLAVSVSAPAQDLGKRPVRLLVPSPPGGPSDFAGRLVAPGIGEALGRNVVVDARQSVNGILSMETGARAAPDGGTLIIGNWHSLFAPRGTADQHVRVLHRAVVGIFAKQEMRDLVAARGSEIIAGTPEALAALLGRDIPRYRKIMAEAGIQPQ